MHMYAWLYPMLEYLYVLNAMPSRVYRVALRLICIRCVDLNQFYNGKEEHNDGVHQAQNVRCVMIFERKPPPNNATNLNKPRIRLFFLRMMG